MSESKKRKKFKETLADLDDDVFPISDYLDHEILFKVWLAAYDHLFPVFDRIDEVIHKGGSVYEPYISDEIQEEWTLVDSNKDIIATGKTFRELCVNLMLADGRDGE